MNDVLCYDGKCKYMKQCEYIIWDLDLNTPMYVDIRKLRDGLKGVTKYD